MYPDERGMLAIYMICSDLNAYIRAVNSLNAGVAAWEVVSRFDLLVYTKFQRSMYTIGGGVKQPFTFSWFPNNVFRTNKIRINFITLLFNR